MVVNNFVEYLGKCEAEVGFFTFFLRKMVIKQYTAHLAILLLFLH